MLQLSEVLYSVSSTGNCGVVKRIATKLIACVKQVDDSVLQSITFLRRFQRENDDLIAVSCQCLHESDVVMTRGDHKRRGTFGIAHLD